MTAQNRPQPSLGLRDKTGQELFTGDTVQIVNGAKSGTILHDIKAVGKPYTLEGEARASDGGKERIEIASRKVMKLK